MRYPSYSYMRKLLLSLPRAVAHKRVLLYFANSVLASR